jgi:antitoxin VapB
MNEHVAVKKIVHVFKNGRSRAVRIPKEFDFAGDEVEMQQDNMGNIIIRPIKSTTGLLAYLATVEPLSEEDWMPEIDDSDLLPLDEVEF